MSEHYSDVAQAIRDERLSKRDRPAKTSPESTTPAAVDALVEALVQTTAELFEPDKFDWDDTSLMAAYFAAAIAAAPVLVLDRRVAELVESAVWFGVHDERWSDDEKDERYAAGCRLQEALARPRAEASDGE